MDHQHIWKVNVWCGIIGNQVVGPVFFDEKLNGTRYAIFIEKELPVLLENLPLQLRLDMWFQQNGCPSHTSRVARAIINNMFPNKWIGKMVQSIFHLDHRTSLSWIIIYGEE